MSDLSKQIWLITGASSGFGRAIAEKIIARGATVVVTARDEACNADLATSGGDQVLSLSLDLSEHEQITQVAARTLVQFGHVDVLVNNAGYGYQSTAEEGVEEEIRRVFEVNTFGLFALTRAVLPSMRERRSGRIINVTSVAGLAGLPGSAYYAAAKHAVEGWSDSLCAEVAPLGIGVTCVEPGPFRTGFSGGALRQTRTRIADYEELSGKRQDATRAMNGQQPGDPERAADVIISVALQSRPPRHLVLGAFGIDYMIDLARQRLKGFEAQRAIGKSADFPSA